MRAAALETAHLWQPHPNELGEANAHLDRLLGSAPGSAAFSGATPRSVRAPGWTLLLVGGFVCAIVGSILSVWRGLTPAGNWVLGRARLALCLTALGVLGSVLALLQA
jgi:hypothetical protein